MSRKCYLKCLQNSHDFIILPHNEEILVGRSKTTKIKDQSCSRMQISLKADCDNGTVDLKQLGVNPSGLDGFAMIKNCTYKVGHGSRIEILLNNYFHNIEFDPPPEDAKAQSSNKRQLDDDSVEVNKNKILKMDTNSCSLKEAVDHIWDNIDNGELYVFTSKSVKSSSRIAAFDMDGTLIKTKSGKVHPVDTKDWQIAFREISKKLQEHIDQGFKIVILSNQAPIGKGRVKIEDFKIKIEKLVEALQVPIQAFLATGKGMYRKPATGMWKVLIEQKNDNLTIDLLESFYCGDAAGRSANWAPGKKKDHSMADKLLAENLGLKFYTPEQFFLGHSIANVPFEKPEFDPRIVKARPFDEQFIYDDKEILVLVGFPGSGKSFLAKQIEKRSKYKYATVCRDKLGSWQKCASEASKLLQQSKSVIVDSTNPDIESRARWTSLAKEKNVKCRCIKMETSFAHSRHNNKFRELTKANHLPVADMVFYSYKNKYKEPTTSEGFDNVLEAKFNPQFEDNESEQLYRMFLLEK